MCRHLIEAGHDVLVFDVQPSNLARMVSLGAQQADTPKAVAVACDVVFSSLPGPREIEQVTLGPDGIADAARPGLIHVDLSTNSPTVAQRLCAALAAKGVTMLDAPVSGGVYGAAAGTLAVMVGGDEDTYNQVKPMLDAIGTHVVYCGEIGNGMVTKICNNLLSMGIGVLMSEALTLGVKAGVSLETLADVIANSSGGNRRLVEKFPRYLFADNFEPGFATALAAKDVRLATDLGREYGIPMELSNLVDQRHVEALFRGWGPEDSDAVAKLQEEKSGVQLRFGGMGG
jgi:3-hydroxyisobutyrate dehydrogenase